jgi:hypothetical protein
MYLLKPQRIRRTHSHLVLDKGMLCSFVHWPKNVVINLYHEGIRFIKDDVFALNMGSFAFIQWGAVLGPFLFFGWEDGWEKFRHHSMPFLFVALIISFIGRPSRKKTTTKKPKRDEDD